jgi:hypothetical protein
MSRQYVQEHEKEGLGSAFCLDTYMSRHNVHVETISSGCSRQMRKNCCFQLKYLSRPRFLSVNKVQKVSSEAFFPTSLTSYPDVHDLVWQVY